MWLREPLTLSFSEDLGNSPKTPPLGRDEVHLFCFSTLPFETAMMEASFLAFLSPEEKVRASGIKTIANRTPFIQSRARLRWLLAHQLGVDAQDIQIAIGPYGKPYLEHHEMTFNLSHSGNLFVIGMARGAAVGVDIENPRSLRNLERLIPEVFGSAEQRRFEGLSQSDQEALFLRGWTLKEAFVKATGRGIAAGLSRVVIREDFEGFDGIPQGDPKDYQVYESHFSSARVALVYEGPIRSVKHFQGSLES